MDAHYCWLCLGVDCFGGRFSLSSGSLPDDLHLELSSEGLSKGHMGPLLLRQVWGFFWVDESHTPTNTLPQRLCGLEGIWLKMKVYFCPRVFV